MLKVRSPNDATEWFIHPDHCASTEPPLTAKAQPTSTPTEKRTSKDMQALLDSFRDYCNTIWGPDSPEPVAISFIDGEPLANFRNSAWDVHPSTFVRGDYCQLKVCGKNDFRRRFVLPQGLAETLRMISGDEPPSCASPLPAADVPGGVNWLERKFAYAARDADGARKALGQGLLLATRSQQLTLIKSVEGIGKTSALMKELPKGRFDGWFDNAAANDWRERNGLPTHPPSARLSGFAAFSFGSYEQARAKCREFNRLHSRRRRFRVALNQGKIRLDSARLADGSCPVADAQPGQVALTADHVENACLQKKHWRPFRLAPEFRRQVRFPDRTLPSDRALFGGKVLRSIHRLYEDVCGELGETPLNYGRIAAERAPSFLAGIERLQPHVYSRMCEHRNAFWGIGADGKPRDFDPLRTVLFVVHDVIRTWGGQTRCGATIRSAG